MMSALWCPLNSPDCTGPRIKGRGWSAQPEVAWERFDVDRGGLQQAGDRQERDAHRIARRGPAPDDPGLPPGPLRHHRPEHLTVALEAVRVEQQMNRRDRSPASGPPAPPAADGPGASDGPGDGDASGTQGSIEKARSHSRDDGPAMSQSQNPTSRSPSTTAL